MEANLLEVWEKIGPLTMERLIAQGKLSLILENKTIHDENSGYHGQVDQNGMR